MILELKRRIEIARAALNREQSISEEEVDKQIEKEYQEFRAKIEKQLLKTPVFNGKGAVDLCIHVGEERKENGEELH